MSDRPTISTLPAGGRYSIATLNSNFQALRDKFDDVLGTNGTAGANNTMSGNLNMGGNTITNAGSILDTSGNDLSLEAAYAAEWANKAEDSLVSALAGGDQVDDYSSLHHAAKTSTSATAAASSATSAASSVTSAATSATNAATSATTATTQASAASTSATAAATSATGAATSATGAATSATNAATSATSAATSATNATGVISSIGLNYNFDTSTTMADPGTGDFRLNHATVASVTAISVDATTNDTGNPDLSDFVATWDDSTSTIGGYIVGKKVGTPATFFVYSVSTVTDNTGWLQLAVSHVASNGTWSSSDDCIFQFSRSGDKGDTGTTGDAGDVFNGVVAKTATYTVVAGDDDYVLTMDASGGSRTFNLTAASTLADGFVVTLKKIDSSSNAVTIDANSSETIDGALTVSLSTQYETTTLICDGSNWHTVLASTPGGTVTIDNYADSTNYTSGSTTTLTASVTPSSENSLTITFDGVMQHHNTYSLSGAVVTFDTAIPTGTDNVEFTVIAQLDIGTPADNTVGYAQLAHLGTADQVLTSNGTGSAPSYQNPAVNIGLVMVLGA